MRQDGYAGPHSESSQPKVQAMAPEEPTRPHGGRRSRRYVVGRVGEIADGDRKLVEVERRSIGIFRVGERYFAVRNLCPHQGGPLCLGETTRLVTAEVPGQYVFQREGEILRCPWHGWEFDLRDGTSVVDPEGLRVKSYQVEVQLQAEVYPVQVDDQLLVLIMA